MGFRKHNFALGSKGETTKDITIPLRPSRPWREVTRIPRKIAIMWQRFTESARKVVFYAQEEAQKFGEGYVSTEHLLLGLVREPECPGAKILVGCGVSLNRVRAEVEKQLPQGDSRPSSDMTLTPRAKRIIDLAYDEARGYKHNYIGTEHLVLGLVREGDGLAGRVLAKLGVDLTRARASFTKVVGDGAEYTAPDKREPQEPREPAKEMLSNDKAWLVLAARKLRMPADMLCLMYLFEENGSVSGAIEGCGGKPLEVAAMVEEELLLRKTPEQIKAEPYSLSSATADAVAQAKALGQDLTGVHFLLAAVAYGDCAIGRALKVYEIDADNLRAWLAENP